MNGTNSGPQAMTPDSPQLSPLERTKSQSDYLRGRIAAELADAADHFSDESAQLLKLHGIYQQVDRDRRQYLGRPDKPADARAYSFMVRTAIPGGRLRSDQLLAELDLCDEVGSGTLRITGRQNLQLYGVAKRDLVRTLRRIHEIGLTTMGASGDVTRNVMCCPAPYCRDPVHGQIQSMAGYLAGQLAPQTPAYREIWLGEAPATPANGSQVEPLYGQSYLPRKLKVAVGLPGDNCVDLYAQDVGLMALCENFQVAGYNVLVGGGMGMSPRLEKTFPALAQPLAMIRPEQVADVVRAILRVFRDFGNRSDRRQARLKYLLAAWGLAKFKAQVEAALGYALAPPHPQDVWDIDDHVGWHEQGDGRWFYGLHVAAGRIVDRNEMRLKSGLREICRRYQPPLALTPGQGILFCDVPLETRAGIEDLLRAPRRQARRPTFPGSPLVAGLRGPAHLLPGGHRERAGDAGRVGPVGSRAVQSGPGRRAFHPPHDRLCQRLRAPYSADIGLVGRAAGRYAIYVGGHRLGDRLGFLYQEGVPLERIVPTLVPLLARFKQLRQAGESLGDFCHRTGHDALVTDNGG